MRKYIVSGQQPPWGRWERHWKSKVYDFIKSKGDEGANRQEIAAGVGLNAGRVSSYLAEMKRAGLLKKLGDAVDPLTLNAADAKLYAMNALEIALGAVATEIGYTPEMNKAFITYQKVKALAFGAKTGGEESAALRQALIMLVKLVF